MKLDDKKAIIRKSLEAILVMLQESYDVEDGDYGVPAPNWAMQMTPIIEQAIEEAT